MNDEQLMRIHPNMAKVKRELYHTLIRQGFVLQSFEVVENPDTKEYSATTTFAKV